MRTRALGLVALAWSALVQTANAWAQSARVPVPYIAGEFARVYTPPGTFYLNDHTLVFDPITARWHLYGITHSSPGAPQLERKLLHASASSLTGPWASEPFVLTALPTSREFLLWAPFVFDSGTTMPRWTMLYWGGNGGHASLGMRRADSTDLLTWQRLERTRPDPTQRVPGGRDPFVLRVRDEWLVYSVGDDGHAHGQIIVTRTRNLDDPNGWSALAPVITDPVPSFGWGNLESPYVVEYDHAYYLFLTRTGEASTDYVRTNVFRSSDPTHWEWEPLTTLFSHAAEVLRVEGRWYITSAGWTGFVGEEHRGLLLAPLEWTR